MATWLEKVFRGTDPPLEEALRKMGLRRSELKRVLKGTDSENARYTFVHMARHVWLHGGEEALERFVARYFHALRPEAQRAVVVHTIDFACQNPVAHEE